MTRKYAYKNENFKIVVVNHYLYVSSNKN